MTDNGNQEFVIITMLLAENLQTKGHRGGEEEEEDDENSAPYFEEKKKKASSAARVFTADGDIFFKIVIMAP